MESRKQWNWQRHDWPNFRWRASRLTKAEERFLLGAGVFLGALRHFSKPDRELLVIEWMSDEAVTTSEIEGEILNRESVQSSIRGQLGLSTDGRKVRPSERGIGEVMVDLHRNFAVPLTDSTLFAWQRMIASGRTELTDVGRYRTHEDPMRVVSGRIYEPKIHFEAPPSQRVPEEMHRFIEWFNRTAPGGTEPLGTLTRAGISHLYFESIHPFEDGNGRVGRAIAEKSIAQSLGEPALTAIAPTILVHRAAYYDALEAANKHNEITDWLAWFAGIALESQQRTLANVEFIIEKTRLLDRVRNNLNDRQLAALLRMFQEGPDGFKGGLSAGNYVAITKSSAATATRDLAELVDLGALHRTGEKRYTRYNLAIPTRHVPRITVNQSGDIVEKGREV